METKTNIKNFQLTLTEIDRKFLNWLQTVKLPAQMVLILFLSVFFTIELPLIANKYAGDIYQRVVERGKISNISRVETASAETGQGMDPYDNAVFEAWNIVRSTRHVITAYNSDPAQCDSTPCITANGFNVCKHGIEDTIAANFLKFGTKVRIPELFGDRVFVVRDRMNSRYTSRIDVWMLDKQDARSFGVQTAKIEVIEQIE